MPGRPGAILVAMKGQGWGVGGARDARGSDPRGRDPGWGGRDSGPRGAGGNGWDPGRPAGRGGDPGADAQTRRMPAPRGVRGMGPSQGGSGGMGPPGINSRGFRGVVPPGQHSRPRRGRPRPSPAARATARRGALADRAIPAGGGILPGRGAAGRLGRWGALQGGLGVCIIVASAAIGAIATMVARSAPGSLLGFFVVVGTVAAALAIRPRAGRMIFPVPVLSYLVAALLSGAVFDRSGVQDGAGHRRGAVDRQRLLRDGARHRAGRRDHHRPLVSLAPRQAGHARPGLAGPADRPGQAGPTRAGTVRAGSVQPGTARPGRHGIQAGQAGTGRDGAARPPRRCLGDLSGIRASRGLRGSG